MGTADVRNTGQENHASPACSARQNRLCSSLAALVGFDVTEKTKLSNAPSFPPLTYRLQAGDPHVAAQVFRRFAHRLIGLASRRLGRVVRGKVEPEDVIQSVFRSFFLRQ